MNSFYTTSFTTKLITFTWIYRVSSCMYYIAKSFAPWKSDTSFIALKILVNLVYKVPNYSCWAFNTVYILKLETYANFKGAFDSPWIVVNDKTFKSWSYVILWSTNAGHSTRDAIEDFNLGNIHVKFGEHIGFRYSWLSLVKCDTLDWDLKGLIDYSYQQGASSFLGSPFAKNSTVKRA